MTPRAVAFLASTLVVGGAERVVFDLVRRIDRRRFRPLVFTLKARGPFGDRIAREGIDVRERWLRRKLDPAVAFRLARAFREAGVEVLYTLDHEDAMVWGRLAARLAGVRAVVTGMFSTRMRGGRPSLSRWNRLTLPFADRLVCAAKGQADYLVQDEGADPRRLVVVHSGVDTEAFRPGPEDPAFRRGIGVPPGAPLAGIVAAFKPEKALDDFLRAAAIARERAPDARFLLLGDGPARPDLEASARALGILPAVRFLGFCEDVAGALRSLRVSVLSSRPFVETFPLSQLEAMASGVPVVSTDVGSIRELVADGETGFLVPSGNPAALAEPLGRLLADAALARRMGEAGRARVLERFTVDRMVRSHEALFESLLGAHPAAPAAASV